jgi:hypothetical protein
MRFFLFFVDDAELRCEPSGGAEDAACRACGAGMVPEKGVWAVAGITLAVDPTIDAKSLQGLFAVVQEDLKPLRLGADGCKGAVETTVPPST